MIELLIIFVNLIHGDQHTFCCKISICEETTINNVSLMLVHRPNNILSLQHKGILWQLVIMPKKGEMFPWHGNYGGIMLPETAYKVLAIIMHNRLPSKNTTSFNVVTTLLTSEQHCNNYVKMTPCAYWVLPRVEHLDHEARWGFRNVSRGCNNAVFPIKHSLKRGKEEHNLETWVLFLDLVKAFDGIKAGSANLRKVKWHKFYLTKIQKLETLSN